MRVLVTYGSKHGGTAGIARQISQILTARGFEVVTVPAHAAPSPSRFDAVVAGGALYANRWHSDARHYIERHVRELRQIPTWLFSSGPLDHSADHGDLPETHQIRGLMDQIGALEHVTFGGVLDDHPDGFMAKAVAKQHAGDFRDRPQIDAWAEHIADLASHVRPLPVDVPHGHSAVRLVEYAVTAWALPAALLVVLAAIAPRWLALSAHAVVVPAWFAYLAVRYQAAIGARSPLVVAAWWTAITGVLELALTAGAVRQALVLPSSVAGLWLPLALGLIAAAAAGSIATMVPPRPELPAARAGRT